MKNLILISSVSFLFAALLVGCGKSAKLNSADQKAFADAAPELKQSWAEAQAAAGTNDYVLAIVTLRTMLGQGLSAPQVEAVQDAIRTYDGKLVTAASHGDLEAQKKLEDLRSAATRRGR
jgi:hypothetical protein